MLSPRPSTKQFRFIVAHKTEVEQALADDRHEDDERCPPPTIATPLMATHRPQVRGEIPHVCSGFY
jgi:hypothetical protein